MSKPSLMKAQAGRYIRSIQSLNLPKFHPALREKIHTYEGRLASATFYNK